jgi:hypothetical protein
MHENSPIIFQEITISNAHSKTREWHYPLGVQTTAQFPSGNALRLGCRQHCFSAATIVKQAREFAFDDELIAQFEFP